MGILDDAIREHLELKRKHGVAEEELQRQEEEALGPARRDVAQQHEETEPTPGHIATAEDGEGAAPAAEETALFDMEQTEAADAEPPAAAEATPAEATPVEPPPVEPPPVEPDEPEDDVADDEPEPEEEDLLAAESDEEALDDQALEDEESEDEDADVLEDTPDFLQETPEHDRLWFEQKPPRDFDFD